MAFFKLRNHATDHRWWAVGDCLLRKRPLIFVIQQQTAAVVWETSCSMDDLVIDWRLSEGGQYDGWRTAPSEQLWMPGDRTQSHFVHRALLDPIEADGQIDVRIRSGEKVLATVSSPWQLRSTTVEIAAVSDNQFNVRVFQQIMRGIRRRRPIPQLLLHAGDAVQTAGSLQQWQTDFWDPISLLGSRSMPPILYSVGNHDYDVTNRYAYTIGAGGTNWRAMSIGRTRWVVLDGQTDKGEGDAQERWFREEVESSAWKQATIRVVVVHHAPFVEFWEPKAWVRDERTWHRLAPIWHDADASLVISGHQHAYSRGFLPHAHAQAYTAVQQSNQLDLSTLPEPNADEGTVYAIIGGAGGTLDTERVEEWGIYERSVIGEHHWIALSIESGPPVIDDTTRVYSRGIPCPRVDRLRWQTLSRSGRTLDKVAIERCVNDDDSSL